MAIISKYSLTTRYDPYSIAENYAVVLFEDSRGWLWAGLNNKGVDVFEPRTGRFYHFPIPVGDPRFYNSSSISSIEEAPDGSIWVAQFGGVLWRISIPSDWQKGFPDKTPPAPVQVTPVPLLLEKDAYFESLMNILRLSGGEMLVTSNRRQFIFDPKTLAYRPHNEALLPTPSPNHRLFQCGIHDGSKGGDMWFIHMNTENIDPKCLRIRQGKTAVFPFNNTQTGQYWFRMAQGKAGHTWLALFE